LLKPARMSASWVGGADAWPPFVEFAGVVDGDVVLDVGSGTGSVVARAADRVNFG
jgi:ubiquinone/menaquinone biosynthesis C-methylase UbiE